MSTMNNASDVVHNGSSSALRIFVSHSSADDAFGRRLVADLRGRIGSLEDAVWYDSAGGLRPGDKWWEKIVHELSARPVFLVVLSPDAMASKWVQDEITLAWQQKNSASGKVIVPLLHRVCDVREDLKSLQMISFVDAARYQQSFDALVAAINRGVAQNPIVEHPERLRATGAQLLQQNRLVEAVSCLERATHLDPNNFEGWYLLASAYHRSQHPAEALAAIERAQRLSSDRLQAWLLRGAILIAMNHDGDALSAIEHALVIKPDSAEAWCNKAVVLFRQEHDREAVQACDRAIALDPTLGYAWRVKANALQALRRLDEAVAAQRTADSLGA